MINYIQVFIHYQLQYWYFPMRPNPLMNRKLSNASPFKPISDGFFKFVLNDRFQVTLRISNPHKLTYAKLLGLLVTQQIIKIVDGLPQIQQQLLQVKNKQGIEISINPFNIAIFAVQLQAQSITNSPEQGIVKKRTQLRPTSARRKLFSNRQLDLLQCSRSFSNKSKATISLELDADRSPSHSTKFRLRRTPSAKKREPEMQSSQLISVGSLMTDSNQFDTQGSMQSTPSSRQKPFRRRLTKAKINLNIKRFHEQPLI